jgi:hypothetical protein
MPKNQPYTTQQDLTTANPNLGVLTSDDLRQQKSFELAPVKPATAAAGLGGELEQRQVDYTANLEREAEKAGEAKEGSLDEYIRSLASAPGEVELTSNAYGKKGGVDDIGKELGDINQELRSEQHALRRQLERLEKNPGGLFGGALQDEMERVERESLKKQADLSIIQEGIQGRYDSAKAIADRAVAVQFERQKNVNEALRLQYEDNKDLFDKTEQRAFESAQGDRERSLDKEENDLKSIYNVGLTAGQHRAPQSVLRSILAAKTPQAALEAAVGYLAAPQASGSASGTGGIYDVLDFRTANAVISQSDKFGSSDIVKKFNGLLDARNAIAGIPATTQNPADHQAIVYHFAKALDPESVVREGEYETIKKYAQPVFSRYKGELKNAVSGSGFLSAEAISNIKQTIENRYSSTLPQYTNLQNSTASKINQIAGKDVAGLVLTDFTGGYAQDDSALPENDGSDDPLGIFK